MKILSNDYKANLPGNNWPTKGGPAKFSRSFSDALVKMGHDWIGLVENYYDRKYITTDPPISIRRKSWNVVNIPNHFIKTNFSNIKRYKDPKASGREIIKNIRSIIKKESPDVVFINGNSCFAWTYLIAAKEEKIPIVALHAGVWSVEIDIYRDMFTEAGTKIMKNMELDFATIPDKNIFLNETSKEFFFKNVKRIPDKKTEIIPLPCEPSSKKERSKKPSKNFNVGIVARWDRIKNHKAFLDLAKISRRENNNWKFYSVTSIPQTQTNKEMKDEYRNIINVVEPMPHPQLNKFYRKMNIMLLPSVFDVSPHVVLEAAVEGVPTFISSGVGYSKKFKKEGLEHFVIDFSDTQKAFKKIKSLKEKKYPTNFVKKMIKEHDPKIIFKKISNVFKEIINENSTNSIKSSQCGSNSK